MNEKIIAIVGLTEAIKQYGIPSEFCPTVAIIIGALLGYTEKPDAQGILEGVVLGATVTGGYAITKKTGQGVLAPFYQGGAYQKKASSVQAPARRVDYSDLEPDDYRGV